MTCHTGSKLWWWFLQEAEILMLRGELAVATHDVQRAAFAIAGAERRVEEAEAGARRAREAAGSRSEAATEARGATGTEDAAVMARVMEQAEKDAAAAEDDKEAAEQRAAQLESSLQVPRVSFCDMHATPKPHVIALSSPGGCIPVTGP